jgi:uncharacterized protein (DUF1800 family)
VSGLTESLSVSESGGSVTDETPLNSGEAFRLLDQGTFGPTSEGVFEATGKSATQWVDRQMSLPATLMLPVMYQSNVDRWDEHINVWFNNVLTSDDQLRQRVAFALSQIFVVSSEAEVLGRQRIGLSNYYDILVRNAFGNFRDLIEEVTLSPVMGQYLSMKGNQKADEGSGLRPDENYAREIMQLFTIGLSELNVDGTEKLDAQGVPIPTYDQTDIEELARVFTGWHFANVSHFRWGMERDFLNPMVAYEEYHDAGGKQLFGTHSIPAGLSAEADLDAALDILFEHPNVGPFISKQLIQRLITSNPTAQYVADVASVFNDNGNGVRGDLGAVVRTIYLHAEARNGHQVSPSTYGKLKEPLLRLTQLWRAFAPDSFPEKFNYIQVGTELAQAPLNSETVFNFYRPDYTQAGPLNDAGLVAPEFQIHDETSIITITMRLLASVLYNHSEAGSPNRTQVTINLDDEMLLKADPQALLDHLDDLLLGGRMSSELRSELEELLESRSSPGSHALRVTEAIFLLVSSPEAAIQR